MVEPFRPICIGSQALSALGHPLSKARLPEDVDLIATKDALDTLIGELTYKLGHKPDHIVPIEGGKKVIIRDEYLLPIEVEVAWDGTSAALLAELVEKDPSTTVNYVVASARAKPMPSKVFAKGFAVLVPSVDVLFALKASHRFLRNTPHFEKTRYDYLALRKTCTIPKGYEEWFEARLKETYWYKHPNLKQDKANFFRDDGIKYIYDHDTIHLSVARRPGVPAYTLFQKEGAQVAVDRQKWEALHDYDKLSSVIEESCVLALERSQIPHPGVWTPHKSYLYSLQKVCTSITSGWWRDYAYEVYDLAKIDYPGGYVSKFWNDVKKGLVKPHVR